jgi:hypothetical protein
MRLPIREIGNHRIGNPDDEDSRFFVVKTPK